MTLYMNDLKDNNKFSVNMYRIHKNPRYKLIELNQKKYLIDLEVNYFFYLFPMLNWILKKDLIEITNDKLNEIEYDNKTNKERSQNIRWISGGAGVLIALLMRPFMDLLDVPSNIYQYNYFYNPCVFCNLNLNLFKKKMGFKTKGK